jgi:hypothetical protein
MYISVSLDSVAKKRNVVLFGSLEPNKRTERMMLNGVNFLKSKKDVWHNDEI